MISPTLLTPPDSQLYPGSGGEREILMSSSKSKSELFTLPIKRASLMHGSKAPAGHLFTQPGNQFDNFGSSSEQWIYPNDFRKTLEYYRARTLATMADAGLTLSTTRPINSVPLPDPEFDLLPKPTPQRTMIMGGSKSVVLEPFKPHDPPPSR